MTPHVPLSEDWLPCLCFDPAQTFSTDENDVRTDFDVCEWKKAFLSSKLYYVKERHPHRIVMTRTIRLPVWLEFLLVCLVYALSVEGQTTSDTANVSTAAPTTTPSPPICPDNLNCSLLPAECIECSYTDSCRYGQTLRANCSTINSTVCLVSCDLILFCLLMTPSLFFL